MASELKITRNSLQGLVIEDLGLYHCSSSAITPLKYTKGPRSHPIDDEKKRLVKSKLKRYANEDLERIVFSVEKLFTFGESIKRQNIRSKHRKYTRRDENRGTL